MAYSEYLVDRVRNRLRGIGFLEEKKMMGALVFMLNGKMCIGVDVDKATTNDRLMVRVGKLNYGKLLGEKGSKQMNFTGKPSKGFLYIYPEGFDSEEDLDFWVEQAIKFNKLLV
ncbi:TfoX/Sxy family protein [Maribacter sp. MMG018]|uniref:TfoX/Sxy family protein n=1 Tax=Maribacter sp. MMG018 TaxID=2822688 RepID=UPI001B390D7C|nr:TfoX/Sxy family protein [Maribacter sp. MMG018]MBQ4914171.1 TfoX/Sxy family protein [Maribacter sp. MMG018]